MLSVHSIESQTPLLISASPSLFRPLHDSTILRVEATTPVRRQHRKMTHHEENDNSPISPRPTSMVVSEGSEVRGVMCAIVLMATAIALAYADRSNISTAIVPMAKVYNWGAHEQGLVLSAFFYGYSVTQIVGGIWADKQGGKIVMAVGIFLWSFFTLATPIATHLGGDSSILLLLVVRVGLGLAEGLGLPAAHALIASHIPFCYQSTSVAIVTGGCYVGACLAFGFCPILINRFGWTSTFHFFGIVGLMWIPIWMFFDFTTRHFGFHLSLFSQPPETLSKQKLSKTSSRSSCDSVDMAKEEEESAVINTIEATTMASADSSRTDRRTAAYKYVFLVIKLLRHKEVWAILIAQYCQSWGFWGVINWLPSYLHEEFDVEMSTLGTYTTPPYVFQGVIAVTCGTLADWLIHKRGKTVRFVRIVFQSMAMFIPSLAMFLLGVPWRLNVYWVTFIITVGFSANALGVAALSVSQLDITPEHPGLVYGMGNTASIFAGCLAVLAKEKVPSWSILYLIYGVHYAVGGCVWIKWSGAAPISL